MRRWPLRLPAFAAAALIVATVSSCGGSDPAGGGASIAPPSRPSARECGAGSSPAQVPKRAGKRSRASAPAAGLYRYRVSGSQTVSGAALRARDLPARGETLVSRSRTVGVLTCFRIQRRLAPDIANTATYVIRGGDVYLVGIVIQALGEAQTIRPDPAVLSATESGSEWSGQFAGPTSGSYSFSVRGRQRFRVGGQRLRAVRISSSVSYRGAYSGTQKATTWLSVDHDLVLGESARSSQDFGVSTLRLRSRSRLISLRPGPLPSS